MIDVAFEVKEEVARGEAEMVDLVLSGDNRLVLLASS
jgi:ribosomal protein L7Ae-like RNA K-turn-binding protein